MNKLGLVGIVLIITTLLSGCVTTSQPSVNDADDSRNTHVVSPTTIHLSENFTVSDLGRGFRVYNSKAVSLLIDESTFQQIVALGLSQDYTKSIIDTFGDNFNFIILRANTSIYPPPNHIAGIGMAITSPRTERSPKLRAGIYLAESSGGPLYHEIAHCFPTTGIAEISPHWGFSDVCGQLGGWNKSTLKHIGENLYQASGNQASVIKNGGSFFSDVGVSSDFYAPLELYLMGLLPASDVPTINVALDPSWVQPGEGIFRASGFKAISILDIISSQGKKIPDYVDSPKSFKAICVILTPQELSQDEWTKFDDELSFVETQNDTRAPNGSTNFFTATQGLATISFDLNY